MCYSFLTSHGPPLWIQNQPSTAGKSSCQWMHPLQKCAVRNLTNPSLRQLNSDSIPEIDLHRVMSRPQKVKFFHIINSEFWNPTCFGHWIKTYLGIFHILARAVFEYMMFSHMAMFWQNWTINRDPSLFDTLANMYNVQNHKTTARKYLCDLRQMASVREMGEKIIERGGHDAIYSLLVLNPSANGRKNCESVPVPVFWGRLKADWQNSSKSSRFENFSG